MPGFEIKNGTIWPLEISLRQISPLYWGITNSGDTFKRNTGAVWFTIRAIISLDGKEHTTEWDAIWPIGAVVGALAFGAIIGGFGAFAAVGALAAVPVTLVGLTSPMLAVLIVGGVYAANAIIIGGATLGAVSSSVAAGMLASIFTKENASVEKMGCYAGLSGHKKYTIIGGPILKPLPNGQMELVPGKLRIVSGIR